MTKAESSGKPGVLASRPYCLLDREVDADPVEERRLPDPLGGVEQELADLALEQGHVELGGAVHNGGDVVLVVPPGQQLPLRAEEGLLHGDVAVALNEGALDLGDVDGGVNGLPHTSTTNHHLVAEERVLPSQDVHLQDGTSGSDRVVGAFLDAITPM